MQVGLFVEGYLKFTNPISFGGQGGGGGAGFIWAALSSLELFFELLVGSKNFFNKKCWEPSQMIPRTKGFDRSF